MIPASHWDAGNRTFVTLMHIHGSDAMEDIDESLRGRSILSSCYSSHAQLFGARRPLRGTGMAFTGFLCFTWARRHSHAPLPSSITWHSRYF